MYGGSAYGNGGGDRRGGSGGGSGGLGGGAGGGGFGGGGSGGFRRGGNNFPGRSDAGPRGGAEHLARIHGTEEDKVNCPFYYKIGACRHGERCSRQHHKPPFSQTILLSHMFQNPASAVVAAGGNPDLIDQEIANDEFEDFFEEVFEELCKFGTVEEMNVCDNLGDHLVGNVYVKFGDEEEADNALKGLFGRWYAGRPMVPEFSPVTDFREARCRQYDEGTCGRGGQCNFMHVRYVSRDVMRYCDKVARKARREARSRSRSKSRDHRRRSRSRDKDRSGRDRDRDKRSKRDSVGREGNRELRGGREDRPRDEDQERRPSRREHRRDSRDRESRRDRDAPRHDDQSYGNGQGHAENQYSGELQQ